MNVGHVTGRSGAGAGGGCGLAAVLPGPLFPPGVVADVIAPGLVPSLLSRQAPKAQRGTGGLLTARERDVLERIAHGRSNREIAEELFVGEETVKSHCSKIYDKLGAKNRHDAVARGLSLGVLG